MGRKTIDLIGQTFGSWTVVERRGFIGPSAAFLCLCACGSERIVRSGSLRGGGSMSCGCDGRERLGNSSRKHGLHKHPAYRSWVSMKDRCSRQAHSHYSQYGGRGITFDRSWNAFDGFWHDMGQSWFVGASLDRKDVNGNYNAENCRWATPREQSNNRRNTVILEYDGVELPLTFWAEKLGISATSLRLRIKRGWDRDRIFSKPERIR